MSWEVESVTTGELGHFRIYFTAPHLNRKDVTFFRDVPTTLQSFSFGDPFGYAACQISFPQIGPLDHLGRGDLKWLSHFSDVDIVLVKPDNSQEIVWEGFVASYDWSFNNAQAVLQVQCQGALFQVDKYVAQPQYPPVPIAYERLIAETFSISRSPHLRTEELRTEWPENWDLLAWRDPLNPNATKIVDEETGAVTPIGDPEGINDRVTVGLRMGEKTTGLSTRVTGGWDKALTGFVASLLETMYTSDYADQWTIRCDQGRIPVLYVRAANRPHDYEMSVGQPGIETLSLNRDYTQFANVIYGSGTTPEGSSFSRQSVSPDNTRTEHLPFASDAKVWPDNEANAWHDPSIMRVETHITFEKGLYEADALQLARMMLKRNSDPGYAGQMTISVDPIGASRYLMRAGTVMKLRYFNGTGYEGMNFHVAEVTVNVEGGTVDLKLDSKHRSLLTIDEVLARTRDPLTPIKMLQVGKTSQRVEDLAAPWSYANGAGYIPKKSKPLYDRVPLNEFYPYELHTRRNPPRTHPSYYVAVNAAAKFRRGRWTVVPVLTSENGDIRRTQFAAYDREGRLLKIPFHVAFYYHAVTALNMPYDGNGPSPFIIGAFQTTNSVGQPVDRGAPGVTRMGDESLIIGWGDYDQPAGYSPNARSAGGTPTGMLTDETSWSYDNTSNPDFNKNPAAGTRQLESAITLYAAFYAEYRDWVYFTGRIYRKEPGIS